MSSGGTVYLTQKLSRGSSSLEFNTLSFSSSGSKSTNHKNAVSFLSSIPANGAPLVWTKVIESNAANERRVKFEYELNVTSYITLSTHLYTSLPSGAIPGDSYNKTGGCSIYDPIKRTRCWYDSVENPTSGSGTWTGTNISSRSAYDTAIVTRYSDYYPLEAGTHYIHCEVETLCGSSRIDTMKIVAYTLTLDYQGKKPAGSTLPDSLVKRYGDRLTGLPSSVTYDGWIFGGWYTDTSYTTRYQSSDDYDWTSDKTLYAKWTPDTRTVTLQKDNGVSSVSGAGEYQYNTNAEIGATLKTGYNFVRWETSTSGFSNNTSNPYTFSVTDNVTYKAVSEAKKYTLKFDYNKPSNATNTMTGNSVTSKTVTYDSTIGDLPNPSLKGWTFNGWVLKGSTITKDTIWKYDEDNLTAVASWTPKKYTLKFDYNKPSNASSTMIGNSITSKEVTFDSAIGNLPNPSMTGWIFNGWVLKGATITKDTIWTYDEDSLVAVASWTAKTYTLNFDYNKPSNATSTMTGNSTTSKTVTYDSAIGNIPNPGMVGWKFDGWLLKNLVITKDTIWRYDEDNLTTKASWTPNEYGILYKKGVSGQ